MAQSRLHHKASGLTLAELMIALSILALFLMLANTSVLSRVQSYTFKSQIQDFISTLQMAVMSAAETGRRYEVIVDPVNQTYLLRQITTSDLADYLPEEVISDGVFGRACRVDKIVFDDGDSTTQGKAKFRAGHRGWAYGGQIIFYDEDDRAFTVLVNRLNRRIEIVEGQVELLSPQGPESLPFPTPPVAR
ncbi:MAG: prepilin-type N-terminal cleavage/methylation domain-containing protein [Planctomycetes bacterium]|nr:prepilin-type N-terminal cleavage/methylation domain-containing protein [Planctomycetota bacterium]